MRHAIWICLTLVPALPAADGPKVRTFKFVYETTVTDLKPGQEARAWLPVPQTTDDQEVLKVETAFPVEAAVNTESTYGNKMFYLAAKADKDGNIRLKAVYTIKRREVKGETDTALKGMLDLFLKPDSMAPPDGKHL